MWRYQVTGTRMAPKPASFIIHISSGFVTGCPQQVSHCVGVPDVIPVCASRVLPKFQPTRMLATASVAVSKSAARRPLVIAVSSATAARNLLITLYLSW